MKRLTNKQLENIKKLSNTVIKTRTQLARSLCEALGDGWLWSKGFANHNGNSIILYFKNNLIQIGTYRFAERVAIKYIASGKLDYYFDKLGNVTGIYRHYEEQIDERTITYKIEKIA